MKPNISMVASHARGVVVSGAMIVILPIVFGTNSVWYAMLITEIAVAIYNSYYVVQCTKKLIWRN